MKIVALPGDGIGPEIMSSALKILTAVSSYEIEEHPYGDSAIARFQTPLPDKTLDACRSADAVLFGASGGMARPKTRSAVSEGGLLRLRQELKLFANLRPIKPYQSLARSTPFRPKHLEDVDFLIIRELAGGIYYGPKQRSNQRAYDISSYTKPEIERIAKIAFEQARKRRQKVTSIDKANVLGTSKLWREVVSNLHKQNYPGILLEHMLVDNAALQIIKTPHQFDVILTENMFGDILSDEAGSLCGSIGLLPSASISNGGPGLFEPIHGSAPNIAGRGTANPIGMILSVAMMLRHLKLNDQASRVETAVEKTLKTKQTPDLGGNATTDTITETVLKKLPHM